VSPHVRASGLPENHGQAAPGADSLVERVVDAVTCLGCGCACDDIRVVVRGDQITRAERACALGRAWFGDGVVPARTRVGDHVVTLDAAVDAAAELLVRAERPLVYLAPELSCEAQRVAVGIADVLGAALDTISSATVLAGILAGQRRGRTSATLGELRNRADLIVFWGVDPTVRYPRFAERYAPDPVGTHVPGGRAGRTVMAVDLGEEAAFAAADLRIHFAAEHEIGALAVARAALAGRERALARGGEAWVEHALALARRLAQARYVGLVYDAEHRAGRDRADGLLGLAQALNGPTRCALIALRGGGNRSGADAVLTWQTGFPTAVDFARGTPRYAVRRAERAPPEPGAEEAEGAAPDARATAAGEDEAIGSPAAQGGYDAVLLAGDPAAVPTEVARAFVRVPCVAIGPHASDLAPAPEIAVDTGVPGIHEPGVALRMDDVPLPLRPPLGGVPGAAAVLLALAREVGLRRGRRAPRATTSRQGALR
jgi:formylmethanofuran dehydrogenase subunit B